MLSLAGDSVFRRSRLPAKGRWGAALAVAALVAPAIAAAGEPAPTPAAAVPSIAAPHPAPALGLDLTTPEPSRPTATAPDLLAPPAKGERATPIVDNPAAIGLDEKVGPPLVVVPPLRPDGRVSTATYKLLCTAVREHFGDRLVPDDATLKSLDEEKLKPSDLKTPEGVGRLARSVGAERAVRFHLAGKSLEISVYEEPGKPATHAITIKIQKKLDAASARSAVAAMIMEAGAAITPPFPASPSPEPEAAPPPPPEVARDVEEEEARDARRVPRRSPIALLAAGVGAGSRDLSVSGASALPVAGGAIPALAISAALWPLQLFDATADRLLSDLVVEGRARRSLVHAVALSSGAERASCPVDDDELIVRAGWRVPLGDGRLPRLGLAVGWSSERSLFACALDVVSTRYQSIEIGAVALQPLLPDRVWLEVVAGPRFPLGADRAGGSFAAELWFVGRLSPAFFARAGARINRTRLARDGVAEVADLRTFFAVELGATLQ